jgi:hypothetical protein
MHCNRLYAQEPERRSNRLSIPEKQPVPVQIAVTSAPVMSANTIDEFPPTLPSKKVEVSTPAVTTFPVEEERTLIARLKDLASATNAWGLLPEIAVLESIGLLFLAWVFVERRAASISQPFLWISLAALILPIAIRLASVQPARRERIGLVLLLGLSLYLVKVMYSPLAFTFPDELSHLRNVNEILLTHHLFQENPIQPVTAFYPGLPIVTSTLTSLSGLSTFSAGILVIGIARLILFLALFLLYEQVSGSARLAGLAVLLYIANPNFLYWISEYAYEPLALPMLTLVLVAVAKRETTKDRQHHLAWTVVALMGMLTVIITHHMSSYILAGLLIAVVVFYAIRSRGTQWGPWDLAIAALFGTFYWLIFFARETIIYLSPVFLGVIQGIFNMLGQAQQSRALFTSSSGSTGRGAPLWEQIVALGSVVVIALGLPFGVFETWKNHRNKIFAVLLTAIAVLYLPMQILRLTKDGWETANRSSEFLFIGIGFALALGIERFWLPKWSGWKSQSVLAVLVITLFFGGLISGWPPRARWPRPYEVSVGNYLIKPQVVSAADWMLTNLGPDRRIAASKADAKILNTYNEYPFTDTAAAVKTMFLSETVGPAERHTLLKRNVEYVMSDRKAVSWDHMIGYFFYSPVYSSSSELKLEDPRVFEKFDGLNGVDRLLDTGDIIVYDVGRYLAASGETATSQKIQSHPTHRKISPLPESRAPDHNGEIRLSMPILSTCGAPPSDTHWNVYSMLMQILKKFSQAGCLGGRMQ